MSEVHDHDRKFDKDVYDKAYFEGDGHKSGYKNYTQARNIVRDQFHIIDWVMRSRVDGDSHLDVGCAYGFGNKLMQERGWNTVGLDVSSWAISKAKELHPGIKFFEYDVNEMVIARSKIHDLVTAVELFEHIETKDVPNTLNTMQSLAEWGLFVVNARTAPGQDVMSNHGDHGHLNNHHMQWWIHEVAQFGEIDFDAMFEFNKKAEAVHPELMWHNRVIVVQFSKQ